MKTKGMNVDIPMTIIGSMVVLVIGILITINPAGATKVTSSIFSWLLTNFGAVYLWFTFVLLCFAIWLYFSKYGNIRLGASTPEYSRYKYFSMVASAGFGAGILYWGLIESLYYYITPMPGGIQANTPLAAEWALAYNFHHWGFMPWALYAVTALPLCYSFYVKGQRSLSLTQLCEYGWGPKIFSTPVKKLLDLLMIFVTIGALAQTMGFSLPLLGGLLAKTFGIAESFWVSAALIMVITVIYTISSYIGIEKGMSNISKWNINIMIILIAGVFLWGPKAFIINNTTNAMGIYLQNIIKMTLETDPINNGGFPQWWTVYFFAFMLSFAPFMAVFITRISKGQRLKDVVLLVIVAGSLGSILFLGVWQSYSLHLELTGAINALKTLTSSPTGGTELVIQILKTWPLASFWIVVFIISAIIHMAAAMNGCAFALASLTSKELDENCFGH